MYNATPYKKNVINGTYRKLIENIVFKNPHKKPEQIWEKINQHNPNVDAIINEVKEIVKNEIKYNLSKLQEKNQMEKINNVSFNNLKNFLQAI